MIKINNIASRIWHSERIQKFIPAKTYCKVQYKICFMKKLNLKTPTTYNEKLQWLKLYDRNPKYIEFVDKYAVRKHITDTVGEEYLIPLICVWDKIDDIDFESLPDQFVLKCTHDSGGVVICKDKASFDIKLAKEKLNKSLKKNYYYLGREEPYKYIKPRIICEKYMVDESGVELKDYKFFCFNGKPKALFVATDRGIDTRFDFFDMEFNHLQVMQHYKNGVKKIARPIGFEEMVELATKLSKNFPHVRVDFYDINGKCYFGELTFYHFSGFEKFEPEVYDEIFGRWIELPKKVMNTKY